MPSLLFVCPRCRGPLDAALRCRRCGAEYRCDDGVADFAQGQYYDRFEPGDELTAAHRQGLELELDGTRRRIVDFYEPMLRRAGARRVLDCGCGNGLSVDLLAERGYDAWGNDVSQLRKWQWRERVMQERLVVASGLTLPFPDATFDAVISSGVIEHIGVAEQALPRYEVRPMPDRDERRIAFLRELLRVTRAGGQILLDWPHGSFPIDFWHGDRPGGARWHSPREGFLPTVGQVRGLLRRAAPEATLEALSPYKRLQFQQAKGHWYGRLFSVPMTALFFAMTLPAGRWLAATPVNPFAVVRIRR